MIRAVQFEKQFGPMETAGDRLIFVREEHPLKASKPIDVTPSGIVMDVREKHASKAQSPISVTPSGIMMAAREEHPKKAQ